MSDEPFPEQQAPQIRVPVEFNAEQVEYPRPGNTPRPG
jgi:hypothetical protein